MCIKILNYQVIINHENVNQSLTNEKSLEELRKKIQDEYNHKELEKNVVVYFMYQDNTLTVNECE